MTSRLVIAACVAALSLPFITASRVANAQAKVPELEIFAVSSFVNRYCPGLRLNRYKAERAFYEGGGYPTWRDSPVNQERVQIEVLAMADDVPRSCARIVGRYGETGRILPGLVVPIRPEIPEEPWSPPQ